jgi:hypothetical protein
MPIQLFFCGAGRTGMPVQCWVCLGWRRFLRCLCAWQVQKCARFTAVLGLLLGLVHARLRGNCLQAVQLHKQFFGTLHLLRVQSRVSLGNSIWDHLWVHPMWCRNVQGVSVLVPIFSCGGRLSVPCATRFLMFLTLLLCAVPNPAVLSFRSFIGNDECTPCPENTYGPVTRGTSVSFCLACPEDTGGFSAEGSVALADCKCIPGTNKGA